MPREESEYLLDMVLAARKAVSFTEGMSFADFERDERTVFSATKAVEIVGEAARGSFTPQLGRPEVGSLPRTMGEPLVVALPREGLDRIPASSASSDARQ